MNAIHATEIKQNLVIAHTKGTHHLLPSSIYELMFTTRHAQTLCDWFIPTSYFN